MKINKAKMMVATLAIVAGAATVGSISGTVAWFQYNTRVTAAYVGTTASVSRNLQIRLHDDNITAYANPEWKTNLEVSDISAYLTAKAALTDAAKKKGCGGKITPVTYGQAAREAALPSTGDFVNGPKGNPMAGQFAYSAWADAEASNYVILPIEVKLLDGAGDAMKKEVFLTHLTLQKHSDVDDANDVSTALRVHFASTTNQLWSKNGAEVATSSKLDLDGDGIMDQDRGGERYNFNGTTYSEGVYGDATGTPRTVDGDAKITSYSAAGKNDDDSPMADDSTAALNKTKAIALGETDASTGILAIKTTIWFEGWALLTDYRDSAKTSAVWAEQFAGKQFDVGMTFAVSNAD